MTTRHDRSDAGWSDARKVDEYLDRMDRLAARAQGEAALVEYLPAAVGAIADLGCGDGRLGALVAGARPEYQSLALVDCSPVMLEAARTRFAGESRCAFVEHDLVDPVPIRGPFDVIVSGFAIHHLEHGRKATLLRECCEASSSGALFANLEVVSCATQRLQDDFYRAIERSGPDPADRLLPTEANLELMRAAGFIDVDCAWRWRGYALLVGWAQ